MPTKNTNFCLSKKGQWNLKIDLNTAENFELIHKHVFNKLEPHEENLTKEQVEENRKKKYGGAEVTTFDKIQKDRAKKLQKRKTEEND